MKLLLDQGLPSSAAALLRSTASDALEPYEQRVDRDALDDPDLVFRREGGGFTRLDRIFQGQLDQVLADFNDGLWPAA